MQAHDSYQEALKAVDQIELALKKDKKGRFQVYVDIKAGTPRRILFEHGRKKLLEPPVLKDQSALVKNGCKWAFSNAGSSKTMLIISGHGTGILTPTYDIHKNVWMYEPDVGNSPTNAYRATRYEAFCEQVKKIVDGKSILLSQGDSFLSASELSDLGTYVRSLLGRKLDIIGFDSCYMAMLEITYELKDVARYMVASQECEEKDGWNYQEVITALASSSPARKLVSSYGRIQRSRGLDRYSLSALDLEKVSALSSALDGVVSCFTLGASSIKDDQLLEAACAARTLQHKLCGIATYADLREFLEGLYSELSGLKQTASVKRLAQALLYALEVYGDTVLASAAGPSCRSLSGCSVYFPTAHIDSSYTGSFIRDHAWTSFLRYFTQSF